MFLRRPLVVTAMLVLAGTAVRSQGVNSNEPPPRAAVRRCAGRPAAPQSAADAPAAVAPIDLPPISAPPPAVQASATGVGTSRRPSRSRPTRPTAPRRASAATARSISPRCATSPARATLRALRRKSSRLREKHPGWEPPQDLFAQSGNSEFEKPLWDLFAQHDYDGVRAGVEAIQDKNPGWQPSSDLMDKLALAEANDKLVKASDAQQWGDVINIAAANKMLLTCADVDAIWRTAEALARTDDEPRAARGLSLHPHFVRQARGEAGDGPEGRARCSNRLKISKRCCAWAASAERKLRV